MILSSENILLLGAVLLIAGVLIGKSGYRTGLPLLLIFLLVGMAFGSDGLGIQFGNMVVAQNIGMVALCIILFTGGMSTSLSAIRPVLVPGLILSTAGVLLTALLTGFFIFWLSGMPWTNIHFALLPWLFLFWAGYFLYGIVGRQRMEPLRRSVCPALGWMGRHSLLLYLLHQPVIYGVLSAAAVLFA